MRLHDFAVEIAKQEGGKHQVNIAQIKEIMKIINKITRRKFYKMVKEEEYQW